MQSVESFSCGSAWQPPDPIDVSAALHRAASLPVARFRLQWTAAQPVDATQFLGSAWRGVFGHELRRLVCVTRMPDCAGCMLFRSCSYPYLFDTPGEAAAGTGASAKAAPHPLVLRMETAACASGAPYVFSFLLAGQALPFLGYAVRAFQQAAERGVSSREYRFQLKNVLQETTVASGTWQPILNAQRKLAPAAAAPVAVPPCPPHVRMRLLSPLRLRKDGAYIANTDSLGEILGAILRRVLLMAEFYGSGAVQQDLAPLFHRVRGLQPLTTSLHWHDWTRYSNRQKTKMQMGGLLGDLTFSTSAIPELWPVLWLGQYLHAGKATSMGLGAYRLEEA